MILYIHGFLSSGNSNKASVLKKYFGTKEKIISPDLPIEPFKAFQLLENNLNSSNDPRKLIVGSSLGAFYALLLHKKYKIPAILINPAIYPWIQLKVFIGENTNPATGKKFLWEEKYLTQLKELEDNSEKYFDLKDVFLIVASDDELINYNETISLLGKTGSLIIWDDSGHEFRRFPEAMELIEEFYNNRER